MIPRRCSKVACSLEDADGTATEGVVLLTSCGCHHGGVQLARGRGGRARYNVAGRAAPMFFESLVESEDRGPYPPILRYATAWAKVRSNGARRLRPRLRSARLLSRPPRPGKKTRLKRPPPLRPRWQRYESPLSGHSRAACERWRLAGGHFGGQRRRLDLC